MLFTTSYDSSLKVWSPPGTWEKKFIITSSMIKCVDPKENLATINEEKNESYDAESMMLRRNIIGDEKEMNTRAPAHSILAQIH